ncbi:hypothetical protein ACSV9I_10720 [Rhizobium sp. G187]|uniref:hypothetical protein n=1 Tax=Rhizobium sp. G187 TaxID=3451352 RepID=UPI003EE4D534
MRIPKPHLSRKVVLIAGAALVMCGGTGAAAVFIGADQLLGPSYAELNGFACTEVQTVEIQKKDRFWIRKYVTTDEPSDGLGRIKTALRVAKAVQEAKKADLVQVVVLDVNGPTSRALIRGRSVGADVIYVPDPSRVPEEASARVLTARYIDGTAAANGQFFGERFEMPDADIQALMAKLDDSTDCLKPEVEVPEGGDHGAAAEGHGEKAPAEGHGEAPADGHGEAPAEGHGEAPADAHGEAPAEGHGEETPVAEHGTTESKGWMATVMGMVGLGGDEAPAADHAATPVDGHAAPAADGHAAAPAEGHGDAPAEDHAAAPADGHAAAAAEGHASAPAEGHGDAPAKDHAAAPADDHAAAPAEQHAEAPAKEDGATPADDHARAMAETPVDGHGDVASEEQAKAPADDHAAAPVEDHAAAPAETTAAPAEDKGWFDGLKSMVGLGGGDEPSEPEAAKAEDATSEDAGPATAPNQGDDWLAKMRAAPIEGGAADGAETTSHGAAANSGTDAKPAAAGSGPDAPAEDEAILPPKAQPKTDEHAKADH